jgi:hypothetical protein
MRAILTALVLSAPCFVFGSGCRSSFDSPSSESTVASSAPRSPAEEVVTASKLPGPTEPDQGNSERGAVGADVARTPDAGSGVAETPLDGNDAEALKRSVDGARNLCESGWAAFNTGEAEDARASLDKGISILEPLGLSLTRKLGGDVMAACLYNLGRVLEDHPPEAGQNAEAAYARSLALRPNAVVSARLKKLLAERNTHRCRVTDIERREERAKTYPSWTAVASELIAEAEGTEFASNAPPLTSDDVAREYLTRDGPIPAGRPGFVMIGGDDETSYRLVVPHPDGTVLATRALASSMGGRCPSEGGAELVGMNPLHTVSFESTNDWVWEDEAGRPCLLGDEGCMSGCFWSSHSVEHQFIDVSSGRMVVISAKVKGLDSADPDPRHQHLVQVERLDGKLVLYGCGTRRAFAP